MTKILVIEDDPTVRGLIVKLLKAEAFEVISSSDGPAGIELAQSQNPDLIICDIMMPGCDGYEVLQHLRQTPSTAQIPFIFLTAKAERAELRRGMELGADDYLTKPFKRAELLGAIAARLAKQAAISQSHQDEMKRASQTLSQLAYQDPLTKLPSRVLLHHELQTAIRTVQQTEKHLAVFCLNLHRFKAINARLGYSYGDQVLQQVAHRLDQTFGQQCTVARLGSDEFGLLLVADELAWSEIGRMAQEILAVLREPFDLDGRMTRIHISLGIALYADHGSSPDMLLNQADTAMRFARSKGRDRYEFYKPELDAQVAERQTLEAQLEGALERQEFQVYYQPQIDMATRRITGAEALLRWRNPDLGNISPSKFIPIAEETGLIVPLGQWVLKKVTEDAISWLGQNPQLRIAVNLSARQFKQENLLEMVAQIVHARGLQPQFLVVELTETSVMENIETTIITLQDLKAMGVQISIDDFGTGYSSLNYLKRFPIDTLKIDRSFVQDITTDSNDAAIARAIIDMAQSLHLKVVAEGVETEEQFAFLLQNGCHTMQGFLFSDPIPANDFVQLLAAQADRCG